MIKANYKTKQTQTTCKQTGITLLELMVAMAVSSVIILGISNIYLSTKKSYVVHDEFARIQENGRYSMETLSSNIRNAGYFGCSSGQGVGTLGVVTNGLNNTENSAWNFETGLMGYEAVGTDYDQATVASPVTITPEINDGVPADWVTAGGMTSGGTPISVNPDAVIAGLAVKGSDILILRTTEGTGVRITKDNSSATLFVEDKGTVASACPQPSGPNTSSISGICKGDILLVSDCTKSRIFQASGVSPGGGPGVCGGTACFNLTHAASGSPGNAAAYTAWTTQNGENGYGRDSEIIKLVTKTYFIGVNPPPGGTITEPSLYLRENDGTPVPLVEGVENMQVLYGIDTSGDGVANRYFSANDVPDVDGNANTVFDGVVSVKLSLLARTPENLPGLNRTAADYAGLVYAMVSPAPAASIMIDPVAVADAAATDQRMRKVYNLTIQVRNKSFNLGN